MVLTRRFIFLFPAAVLAGLASASASDSVLQASTGSTGRSLLQTNNGCPMSFESQDYTIITSRCKAPQYPPTECCDAFKEFACPFAVYSNAPILQATSESVSDSDTDTPPICPRYVSKEYP